MDEDLLVGALAGAVGALVVIVPLVLFRKAVTCAKCGRARPKLRKPDSLAEGMWGAYTCACGAQLDAKGRVKR
jgi:hypothetical protein